jgi:hypothetical protein
LALTAEAGFIAIEQSILDHQYTALAETLGRTEVDTDHEQTNVTFLSLRDDEWWGGSHFWEVSKIPQIWSLTPKSFFMP